MHCIIWWKVAWHNWYSELKYITRLTAFCLKQKRSKLDDWYCYFCLGSDNLLQDIKSNLKSSASSEVSNKWVPEKTFDNNPSLYPDFCDCCFGTGRFAGVFWQIDLGNIYLIHSIEVLSRADIEVQILKGGNSTRDEPGKYFVIWLGKSGLKKSKHKRARTHPSRTQTHTKMHLFFSL